MVPKIQLQNNNKLQQHNSSLQTIFNKINELPAAAGSGGIHVPLLTVNFTVEGGSPINVSYLTVVDNALQFEFLYGVYNGSFQTIPNIFFEVWTDAQSSMWGDDIYPSVESSMGSYVGGNGSDYSMVTIPASGIENDVCEITIYTSL